MRSFTNGITYLRQEALKTGFVKDSDNDDTLVERLSQVIRKLGRNATAIADKATEPVQAKQKVAAKK